MNPADFKRVVEEDKLLKVGDEVIAHWTSSGACYAAKATITKLNIKSLKVRLLQSQGPYNEGHPITCPRALSREWTWDNRAALLPTKTEIAEEVSKERGLKVTHLSQSKPLDVEDLRGMPLTKVQPCKGHSSNFAVGNDPADAAGVPFSTRPTPTEIPVDPKEWAEWCQKNGKWSKLHDAIAYAYVLGWYAKGATTDEGKFAAVLEAFKTNPELRIIAERML